MKVSSATAVIAVSVLASVFLTTGPSAQPMGSKPPPGAPHGTPQKCPYDDASDCVTPSPHPPRHPNIVPISVKLKTTYPCQVDHAVYVYSVTVKNTGPVAYVNASGPGGVVPLVWVDDEHNGGWPHGWYGMEVGGTPTIAPGATATVDVQIPYYSSDPKHMTAYATHPFQPRSLGYWVTGKGMTAPGVPHNGGPVFNLPAPKGCP